MHIEGQVGPQFLSDGVSSQPFRQGRTGEQIVTELHGRFYEASRRNALYMARAIVTAPQPFNTTNSIGGPVIWNGTSNVVASIIAVGFGVTTNTTVNAAIGLTGNTGQTAAPTATGADSTASLYIGGAGAACAAYRVASPTLAGNFLLPLGSVIVGTGTSISIGQMNWVDVGGAVVIPPNCWGGIGSSATATTLVMQSCLIWEEIPY